jgi:hypothetical protein
MKGNTPLKIEEPRIRAGNPGTAAAAMFPNNGLPRSAVAWFDDDQCAGLAIYLRLKEDSEHQLATPRVPHVALTGVLPSDM